MKPKEFWLREEYKNDKYEFFSCEIATRKPNLESHNESDFKDALHVIEYSAYEKLKAQLEKCEDTLYFYASNWGDQIQINEDLPHGIFKLGQRAREYFKEKEQV